VLCVFVTAVYIFCSQCKNLRSMNIVYFEVYFLMTVAC
jgi:hypothetical protein